MKKYLGIITAILLSTSAIAEDREILNVSYDPTRELYEEYNKLFAKHWKETKGEDVKITQSHGGSGKQARGVIDGLQADIVTLALAYDIDAIAERAKLLPTDWQTKLPHNSTPYSSTIVFLVKKGNPKNIKDWDDLTREGIQVITPNPKTSGGARWNYLAAYGYALQKFAKDEKKAQEFVGKIYKNAPVLDAGARGASITFARRGLGDVLIPWENEAHLAVNEIGKDKFDIVVPSISILAEPPVAVVEKVAAKKGSVEVAQEYLNYLYSPEAQEIIARNYYRPYNPKYASKFPKLKLLTIADFGGWKTAQDKHFSDGGVFDQIFLK